MTPTNFSKQAKINYRQAMTIDFFSYRHDESRHKFSYRHDESRHFWYRQYTDDKWKSLRVRWLGLLVFVIMTVAYTSNYDRIWGKRPKVGV